MTGTVTANAGAIGGFTIANTHITGSGGTFVTSNKATRNGYDVTRRSELSSEEFVFRTWAANQISDFDSFPANTFPVASHKVLDLVNPTAYNYFQSEIQKTSYRNVIRTETMEFGLYSSDGNDTWTTGNLFIGQGGRPNSSIRAANNDSQPDSIIYPDTSNGGWVLGDAVSVEPVNPGYQYTRTYNSYTFSVKGTSYFSDDMRLAGGLGVGVAANATNGTIYASNNIVAYASDRRLKENVETIKSPLEKVLGLEGVTFNWNELAGKEAGFNREESQVGLLAQDLQKVLPEAVKIAPFDSDPSGSSISGENYLTIQYERVVPLLVESIKEMGSLIGDLESRIRQLEDKG